MKELTLKYLVKEPKEINENTPLIFLFHGYGSHEEDLFSFATELPENAVIISARAPLSLGFGGYAWYSINFTATQGKFSDIPEAKKALELIGTFISEIQELYKIKPENTFLVGFSQGTILSYATAFNHPEKVQKVVALSGYVNEELLPVELDSKDYSNLDFFISHGTVDQVIPVSWAQQAPKFMEARNISYCYQEYPVGHGVAPKNFFDFKNWIEERI